MICGGAIVGSVAIPSARAGGQVCGDATRQGTEECDGSDLGGNECATLGFAGGTLACSVDCEFDTSGCTSCGNNFLELGAGEECDGSDLGGQTCQDLGFADGTLACALDFNFDASGCSGIAPVPALTTPGLILMALLLVGLSLAGVAAMRRRSRVT